MASVEIPAIRKSGRAVPPSPSDTFCAQPGKRTRPSQCVSCSAKPGLQEARLFGVASGATNEASSEASSEASGALHPAIPAPPETDPAPEKNGATSYASPDRSFYRYW